MEAAGRAGTEAELAQAAGQVGRGGTHAGNGLPSHQPVETSDVHGPSIKGVFQFMAMICDAVWCDSVGVPVSCEVGLPAGGAEVGEAGPGEEEQQQQHGGQGCCLPSHSRLVKPHVSPTLATVLAPSCSLLATKF